MRFTLSSSALNSKLVALAKVINTKNSISILDSFLFEIKDGNLTITASDTDNLMRFTMALSECDGEGRFCVPNRIILASVKELAEQPLTFEVNTTDYSISVNYQNGSYRLIGQSADEYPVMKSVESPYTETSLPLGVLAQNISRTVFATATDDLHTIMHGVFFDLKEESLNIVASDGYKMVRNMLYSCKTDLPASFLLPKKPANLIRNILSSDDENTAYIRFNAQTAEIVFTDGQLICKLEEGRFPNYDKVIPKDNPNLITIDRKALMSALRHIMPFTSENIGLVKLRLTANNLELQAEDIDFATSAREDIVCEYGGVPMSIGFKGAALYEVLNNLDSDDIIIELGDPSRAGLIHPATQNENEDVLMLIMPMLLNE